MHSELPSIEDILLHKVVDVVFKGVCVGGI